VVAGL